MTNRGILKTAMLQSAVDCSCASEDFSAPDNRVVLSAPNENARRYLSLPFDCQLVSYGGNVVASMRADMAVLVQDYIDRHETAHCFETPNLHVLNDALQQRGLRVCFMAEYFLPDVDCLRPHPCTFQLKILAPRDFRGLYRAQWKNALCETRRHRDMLAVGAYDGHKLVGLAGAAADCDTMWQVGVDVLPQYRRQGLACALTSRLAAEILALGKVPFYCAAWSNIPPVKNAIKSGFCPAWVEATAKNRDFVDKLNR